MRKWLKRLNIPHALHGKCFVVHLSDLPSDVRRAWLERDCELNGLQGGTYDDAAHEALLAAPPKLRAEAERKAEIVRYALHMKRHVGWSELQRMVAAKFPGKGTSKASLKALLKAVDGVDPVNFAPALVRDQKGGAPKAATSPEAWQFFLSLIARAAPEWPLKSAWRDVRDVAKDRGWDWPSYPTITRRWDAMTETERLTLRLGKVEAAKRLAQPVRRDKTSILPLDWVSLDGRTLDFWVTMPDGKAQRPVMLALVDVASNYVLGFELVASENAAATARLIRRVVADHGIFDRLYTDNGSAFAGHQIAGGAEHRFRNASVMANGLVVPGVCKLLDIGPHFALPANGQAKAAERTFATLSRAIDDRPEFRNAHAGHAPGAAPASDTVPVDFDKAVAVVRREVQRHNAETGRRAQGARARSYQQVFEDGLRRRTRRVPTARQLWLAGLVFQNVAVTRHGQVQCNGTVYGGPETQDALLPYHKPGSGVRILLGTDPEDFSAPAIAFDKDGRLICEDIHPVKLGPYGSKAGAREAARYRKAAREGTRRAAEALDTLDDKALAAALATLPGGDSDPTPPAAQVVEGHFASPLRTARVAPNPDCGAGSEAVAHMRRNFDRFIGFDPKRQVGQ